MIAFDQPHAVSAAPLSDNGVLAHIHFAQNAANPERVRYMVFTDNREDKVNGTLDLSNAATGDPKPRSLRNSTPNGSLRAITLETNNHDKPASHKIVLDFSHENYGQGNKLRSRAKNLLKDLTNNYVAEETGQSNSTVEITKVNSYDLPNFILALSRGDEPLISENVATAMIEMEKQRTTPALSSSATPGLRVLGADSTQIGETLRPGIDFNSGMLG